MAKIVPYADPNAHGSIGKTITFRRRGSGVLMESYRNPRDKKSAGQLLQREKVSAASKAYNLISGATKYYFRKRGTQKSRTGKDYYLKKYLTNSLPSTTHKTNIKSVQDMVLFDCIGIDPHDIKFTLTSVATPIDIWLWSKLDGAVGGWIPSEIGPDGQLDFPVNFYPAKFGNGVKGDSMESRVIYNPSGWSGDHGIIAFWFKTDFDVVNGRQVQEPAERKIWLECWNDQPPPHGPGNFYIYFKENAGDKKFCITIEGSNGPVELWLNGANWLAGSWNYFCVAYDRFHTFDDAKTISVYINETEINSSTADWGNYIFVIEPMTFNSGEFLMSGPEGSETIIDNLKIYPTANQLPEVLENKENEGMPATVDLGVIYDNENIFFPGDIAESPGKMIITIENLSSGPLRIPFRAFINVSYTKLDDEQKEGYLRLPEIDLGVEPVTLYIATDWSTYWDEKMHRLASSYWV